jgi:hypothetical protein
VTAVVRRVNKSLPAFEKQLVCGLFLDGVPFLSVGEMAVRYPTATEIPTGGQPMFTLFWSAKISEPRAPPKKVE